MATKVVGIADCATSANPADSLETYALGSCIAVTAYDPVARIGGLLHFLLPDGTFDNGRCRQNPLVCADTGVPELIHRCLNLGAQKHRLTVRAAGGANVLQETAMFNIGHRNHLALRKVLWKVGLLLHAEAIGGDSWRSVRLDIDTGKVWVKQGVEESVELSPAVRRMIR